MIRSLFRYPSVHPHAHIPYIHRLINTMTSVSDISHTSMSPDENQKTFRKKCIGDSNLFVVPRRRQETVKPEVLFRRAQVLCTDKTQY